MTPDEAVAKVAHLYGITPEVLTGRWGAHSMAEPRLVLLVVWRKMGLTFDEMAGRLGLAPSTVYFRWRAVGAWHEEAAEKVWKEMGNG